MSERACALLVRYGEIFLKGDNRGFFERKLGEAIRRAVDPLHHVTVERLHGRFLVTGSREALAHALERVTRVAGVTSVRVATVCRPDLDDIQSAAVDCVREHGVERVTFKVETTRSDKRFPLTSIDVSRQVGAAVVQALGLPVDVHHPELRIGVEIGTQGTFVWTDERRGVGGLPVGTAGRMLLLLSGGIDSPVAGWLLQKRGAELGAVYFHSFPYTGDKTREKVTDLARVLACGQGSFDLHVVHFTDSQKALRAAGPAEIAVVLYRRMMIRIADALADKYRYAALATGENLGQVASQTLENMQCIEQAARRIVLRPLLTYDKTETIALARRVGTYDLSILPYDDCCSLFVPEHPATRARMRVVEAAENRLDIGSLVADCVRKSEVVRLTGS